MSRLLSNAVAIFYPSGQNGLTVTHPTTTLTSPWANWGSWVEFSADTGDAAQALAGVSIIYMSNDGPVEVQVGVGAAGAESSFVTCRGSNFGGIGCAPRTVWLDVPVSRIPAHSRLAVRIRTAASTSGAGHVGLTTVPVNAGTDFLTVSNVSSWPPDAAPGLSLTPSATPWAPSSWLELIGDFTEQVGLAWLSYRVVTLTAPTHWEVDLAYGAAGAEVVATTLGSHQEAALGEFFTLPLPGVIIIPPHTRIAVRLRKSDTTTTAWNYWSLSYYGNFNPVYTPPVEQEFPPDSDISGQTIGLTWIEFLDRAGGAHVSSKVELPDPDSFYHGWKDGDIIEWGKVRRALSDSRGQYEATSFTWRLSDAARKWRGMLAAAATKIFLNRSVVMRMISDEERRKWHHDPPLD